MSIDAVFAQFFDDIPDPRQHAKIFILYDVLFLSALYGQADFSVRFIFLGFNPRGCLKMVFLSMTPSPGSSPVSNQSRFRPRSYVGLKPSTSTPKGLLMRCFAAKAYPDRRITVYAA
ncbi:hypothetical protein BANRA_05582 [Klebsiella pneumoniae]|nr:hypothetical protein BANRA_05582 [Klebsiella pneumoniae]